MISRVENLNLSFQRGIQEKRNSLVEQPINSVNIKPKQKSILEESCFSLTGTYDGEKVLQLYRNVDSARNKVPKILENAKNIYNDARERIDLIYNIPTLEEQYAIYDDGYGYITRDGENQASLSLVNREGFPLEKITFNPENNEIYTITSTKRGSFFKSEHIYSKIYGFNNEELNEYVAVDFNEKNNSQKEKRYSFNDGAFTKYQERVYDPHFHKVDVANCSLSESGQILTCRFE